ncbi:MAG TPA: methyltransferase domain-containing protein [Casimicrobiaceae bacterium]|nr:methyltransferase domain-containing protein [Casimicrobiaceae bacterium]
MSESAQRLLERYYGNSPHPYRIFEDEVDRALKPESVLLDAGCGRTVPVLRKFIGRATRLIGVELVDFTDVPAGIETFGADLSSIPIPDASVDVVMSRSVFEHLDDPAAVYAELARILKPGGQLIFLTANMWDYATLIARLVPNRLHPIIVSKVEGREEEDVFPVRYRTNTRRAVARLAAGAGLEIENFRYLGQYPNYFMFNAALFLLGTGYDKLVSRFESLRFLRGWILVTLRRP